MNGHCQMRLSVTGVSKAVWFLTGSRLIPAMLCDTPCEDPLEGLERWRMSPLSDQLETMQSLAFDCQGPLISKRQQIGLNLCCAFAGVVGAITHCDPKFCARSSLSHVNSCQSMMQWQEGSNQHHPCWDIWRWSGYRSKRFRYLFFFGGWDKHRFTSYLDVQCTRGSTHAQKYESVNLVWCWALCLDFTVAVG